MTLPGLTWGGTPNPSINMRTWQQAGGQVAQQWRDGTARGPLWFGRQRRRELVAMPAEVWSQVWGAALAALDAALAEECRGRLSLSTEPTVVTAASVAAATGDRGSDEWVGSLRTHPAALADLATLEGGGADLAQYLLAEEGNLAEIAADPLLWRGLYWTAERTWVTVWHEGVLALARPAPTWLTLSLADGPTVPDRET